MFWEAVVLRNQQFPGEESRDHDASCGTGYRLLVCHVDRYRMIAVVGLLRGLGYDVPIWEGLSEYWPVLIIGWGLVKLLDSATTG